jgi:5'/3'-nucleotidase SurE
MRKLLVSARRIRVIAVAVSFALLASLGAASAQVKVILTNDDGISAIGLQAVYDALLSVTGIDLTVVAPAAEASGAGFGFNATSGGTLNVTSGALLHDGVSTGYAVAGNPADCVRWALKVLFPGDVSDIIVISGSNRGQNYGLNYPASGTVGGAGMATILGVKRAIAVSQGMSLNPLCLATDITEFEAGAKFVANLLQALVNGDESVEKFAKNFEKKRVFLNINVPNCGAPDGATVAKKLAEHAIVTTYTAGTPSPPTTPYTIGFGDYQTVMTNTEYALSFDPKTDVGAVAINLISVATIELPRAIRGGGKVDESLLTGVIPPP